MQVLDAFCDTDSVMVRRADRTRQAGGALSLINDRACRAAPVNDPLERRRHALAV
jgi:hypothetical protein